MFYKKKPEEDENFPLLAFELHNVHVARFKEKPVSDTCPFPAWKSVLTSHALKIETARPLANPQAAAVQAINMQFSNNMLTTALGDR